MITRQINWVGDYEFKVFFVDYMDSSSEFRLQNEGYLKVEPIHIFGAVKDKVFVYARPKPPALNY